jgi:hypothetical protein
MPWVKYRKIACVKNIKPCFPKGVADSHLVSNLTIAA